MHITDTSVSTSTVSVSLTCFIVSESGCSACTYTHHFYLRKSHNFDKNVCSTI